MKIPSEALISVLSTIELAIAVGDKNFRGLKDKDVEFVYDAFHTFFKGEVQGRELPEPSATSRGKDTLIELIFGGLEVAEEQSDFDHLINGDYKPAGKAIEQVEELYVIAFNYLKKSVRFWRKKDGPRGYLNGPIRDLAAEAFEG